MFGSSVLDVAIGVVFTFLLLSLLASAINEIVFSYINLRGKDLLRGIATLLDDVAKSGLVDKVYNHGQVFGLFEGTFDPKKPDKLPSYIPSRNFALALLDSVAGGSFSQVQTLPAAQAGVAGAAQTAVVLTQAFKTGAQTLANTPATAKVGKPLLSMMAMANDDAAKLQKSVEDWYNSGMDRVSGWYKYRTQWMLFAIGVVMAVAMNADTLHIVRQLSQDSTLRAAIVAAAQSAKAPQDDQEKRTEDRVKDVEESLRNVNSIGVPLGWHKGDLEMAQAPNPFVGWLLLVIGWLLTGVAVSLGAPFWFDILNKIMVIRSTVKPREKSHDEGSKD